MRAVLQRVVEASVAVDGEVVGSIEGGLLALVGVTHEDGPDDATALAHKIADLRIFGDAAGAMNRSVVDTGGAVLVVSQFTLYADVKKGRRPSFVKASRPEHAEPLVELVAATIDGRGVQVASGRFGALMEVSLVNDGPVTVIVETRAGAVI